MSKAKVCFAKGCHNLLKPPKRKYCSTKCSKSTHNAIAYAKKNGAVYEPEHDGKPVAEPNVQKRRGEVYQKLKDSIGSPIESQLVDVFQFIDMNADDENIYLYY